MAFLGNVEYRPDETGVAETVKCPLVDGWIDPIDCMENQAILAARIPDHFKSKPKWKEICLDCPFRHY